MSRQSHVLIDAETSVVADGTVVKGRGNGAAASDWQVRLRTCRGGRSEGVHVVEIDNGMMTIDILPTRGMGIWRVRRNISPSPSRIGVRGGATLGWQAPAREPVNPAFVPLMEPAGLGWLDGFHELLCRCGLESNGPPEFDNSGRLLRPLHGRIANTPAHRAELIVDEDEGKLVLRGVIDESRFHFQSLRLTASISTTIGSNEFTWADEVENFGGRDATLQMLYHFNLGQPLLREGATVAAPISTVAPLTKVAAEAGVSSWSVMPPPTPGSAEQVFVAELLADDAGHTRVLIYGLANNEAVGLKWSKSALPCFTVWRNTPSEADGYVLGIEPGTNYPNARTFEQKHGRTVTLKPGETWSAEVTAAWHTDQNVIAAQQEAIATLQKHQKPELLSAPRADWSASP
jgi:hypothetical protein